MGLFSRPNLPEPPPARPSRLRLFFIILMIYGGIRLFGSQHFQLYRPSHTAVPPPAPIVADNFADDEIPGVQTYRLGGRRVRGNGISIDLGDRRTHLPGSILSQFFPDAMILPSCLTQTAPAPAHGFATLPVRDDWPGFYGAPWIARVNGMLIVLLNVYAPRNTGLPVPSPGFELYPGYNGKQMPALTIQAPARFYRGSKAVLYRVFLNGPGGAPLRCLDLVVQNGENNGIAHLYYRKYHHYYVTDANFVIQQ